MPNKKAKSSPTPEFLEVEHINELIDQLGASGGSLQGTLQVSDGDAALMEQAAHQAFKDRQYKDSADAYLLLATLNPQCEEYWMQLGIAAQLADDSSRAITAFSMATWANPSDPTPQLHMADCFIGTERLEQSIHALTLAVESIGQRPDRKELMNHVEVLRRSLMDRKKEK